MNTTALFFVLNADFQVQYVSTSPVSDDSVEIVVRKDILEKLGVTQLVSIAKSMSPDVKVNTKQSREIVLNAIENELKNYPVRNNAARATTKTTTKDICWNAFDTIDMSDRKVARTMIDNLVAKNEFPKRVVQSYASDYRKAKRAT